MREGGIRIIDHAVPTRISREHDGVHTVLADGEDIVAEQVVVAAGRAPRTADLGLETIGLEPGNWLHVDDGLLVQGRDALYAVGDVNQRALLTHQGKYQARAAGAGIVERANGEPLPDLAWSNQLAPADRVAVPQVVFTDPEVASVGMTAAQAEEAGMRARVVDYDLGAVAGASLMADGYAGHARAVVDEDRRVIVGMTLVGPGVGELIHAATIAIVGEVPLERLWHAVPAYPTVSEIWLRLLETYGL